MLAYDTVVAGASVAGLTAARQIASNGYSVLVLEEDMEIGLPEKCDGLVSAPGLKSIGVLPGRRVLQNRVQRAVLYSPSGVRLEIDARKQQVVVLDRSELDRELAEQAHKSGAELMVGRRVETISELRDTVEVQANGLSTKCRMAVDARGCSVPRGTTRLRTFQAGRYEVQAAWVDRGSVEIFFDQASTPGFFTWVIPINEITAKVGAAGNGINPFKILDRFLEKRGKHSVIKKIAAPIVVSGPADSFVKGKVVLAGDAAGQCKPSTAGGIFSGGMGGLLAGEGVAQALGGDARALSEYEKRWRKLFNQEFDLMLRARMLFEKLSNHDLDRLFKAIAESHFAEDIAQQGDFDRHSIALLKGLGIRNVMHIVGTILGAELRGFLASLKNAL